MFLLSFAFYTSIVPLQTKNSSDENTKTSNFITRLEPYPYMAVYVHGEYKKVTTSLDSGIHSKTLISI